MSKYGIIDYSFQGGRGMNDITILHLSDLHIDESSQKYSRLLKGLIDDIKKEIVYVPDNSLVTVVTGDIIHKGKKNATNNALSFFRDLYKVIKEKSAGIYIVPGNHDKSRTAENEFLIPAYRANINENKFDGKFFEKFWKYQRESYEKKGGTGYLELTREIYKIFGVNTENQPERNYIDDTFGVDVIEVQNKKYCFVMLNTAWSCIDEDDTRKLILGKFQIDEIKKQFFGFMNQYEDDIMLTMVLGHHPIECLSGKEQDAIFSEMISFEHLNANAYICGHTHDRAVINWGNNVHSINTLMSGIGWPETNGNHVGNHTYSMYVFNLGANSVDIYVRGTDDGGTFYPDFRIYTREVNKDEKKIVFPIKTQDAQAYIPLATGPERTSKAFYISKEFLEYMHEYVMKISLFRQISGMLIEADKSDFYENLDFSRVDAGIDIEEIDNIIYNYLFADVNETSEDVNEETDAVIGKVFELSSQDRYDMFWGFLQRMCQKLERILVEEKITTGDIVRVHFRYLADKNTYSYYQLCASFPEKIDPSEHELSEIQFGELIEAAFKTKKGLIYSINKDLCEGELKEKWNNFLTVVPLFSGNEYERRYSESSTKKYPFITFGITTNSERFDNLLYCMDFFSINVMLEEVINSYVRIFKIDINKFCNWVKNEVKKG